MVDEAPAVARQAGVARPIVQFVLLYGGCGWRLRHTVDIYWLAVGVSVGECAVLYTRTDVRVYII